MIKRLKIQPLKEIGSNDRGATYVFENQRTGEFLYGFRKKGSLNGNHYHKGISSTKNPEIFILLSGEVNLKAKDLRTGEEGSERITGPCRMEIQPEVWHSVEALTDIFFIELNSLEEHAQDTFRE